MTAAEQRPERATHAEAEWDVINWDEIGRLASRFSAQLAAEGGWYGDALYGEMIRRALTAGDSGLTTKAAAERLRHGHTVIDRVNREQAEAALARTWDELNRARAAGAAEAAASRSHALARAAANPLAMVVSRQVVIYTTRWAPARPEPTTVLDDVEPLFDPAEAVTP